MTLHIYTSNPLFLLRRLSSTTESVIFISVIFANYEGWRVPEPLILPFRMKKKIELARVFTSQKVFKEMANVKTMRGFVCFILIFLLAVKDY